MKFELELTKPQFEQLLLDSRIFRELITEKFYATDTSNVLALASYLRMTYANDKISAIKYVRGNFAPDFFSGVDYCKNPYNGTLSLADCKKFVEDAFENKI
jgi:hypothetical protein